MARGAARLNHGNNNDVCQLIMNDFAAIDFETANNERSSVCAVGVVIVRNGEIVDTFYSLIQPEPNYYSYWCTRVHGLCCDDTDDAPIFPEVWKQIEPLIQGLPLVAHNSRFDTKTSKKVVSKAFILLHLTQPQEKLCQSARKTGI